MSNEQMLRDAFEAWARPIWTTPEDWEPRIKNPSMFNSYTLQAAWAAWQASAALAQPAEGGEVVAWMRKRFGEDVEYCEKPFTTDWTPLYTTPPASQEQAQQPSTSHSGQPTTYAQRFTDAVRILCGKMPPADMVDGWLDRSAGDHRLQEFAIEHGPSWAQGIVLLDAAHVMADQPEEGVDHEPSPEVQQPKPQPMTDAPQAAPIPCAVHVAGRTFEAGTMFCDVIDYIESNTSRWVASADRYPPEGERVFFMDRASNMVGFDMWAGEGFTWMPSHWMRIPPVHHGITSDKEAQP